ncbi:MAG: endo-1,4-beta-xylanase [Acidobacteriaceae bacterium]
MRAGRWARREFLERAARLGAGATAATVLPLIAAGRAYAGKPRRDASTSADVKTVSVTGDSSLGAAAAAHGLLYGCAVNMNALGADAAYAALVREQCRILVAENAMKWGALRPSAEGFNFDQADAMVAFAEANRMKIRGHNLAWHQNNPKWLEATATKENARELLVAHIETVAGRYSGRMHSWDVVNEAIRVEDGRADGLRNSVWLRLIGEEYIELAFKTAREADPQALLTYNDYGVEPETREGEQKREAVIEMLRRMVARRVPVDAVGVQSHIAAAVAAGGNKSAGSLYGAGLMRFIGAVRELGLQVFVTEMDVNDRALAADEVGRDAAVAAAYRQYLELVLGDPAVKAVLTWGITDRYTWLGHEEGRADGKLERPLPFDAAGKAKAAFFAVREVFDQRGTAVSHG